MDFARKQLEKYGWRDGKGLGKHENGISQALKPKLKRSVAGVGYDAASDFTEHWWSALYDKAAKNVEVEEKNGKTKKIKTKQNYEFEITNSTWKIHKKKKKDDESAEEEYSDFFVRTDVLTGGKVKTKKVKKESDSEDEPKDPMKLTDKELFAACEGRTAHKGARHGLKALGKLARIEQQEQMLLKQARFKGYSHAKSIDSNDDTQVFEESNLNTDCDSSGVTKKKKKKKRCNSFRRNLDAPENNVSDCVGDTKVNKKEKKSKQKRKTNLQEESTLENNLHENNSENSNNIGKTNDINEENVINVNVEGQNKPKLKKKKRNNVDRDNITTANNCHSVSSSKKRK